ncbi:MAG: hypothetical protein QF707_07940 [Candidatus Poseidoniaceae archaeon]|nr:hypothetical protein [Candidatus Poseidoniaceae archaeon]
MTKMSKYLKKYLEHDIDWEACMTGNGIHNNAQLHDSELIFQMFYPEKSHEDFFAWRHLRSFHDWEDEIYSMDEEDFEHIWPLRARIILEYQGRDEEE